MSAQGIENGETGHDTRRAVEKRLNNCYGHISVLGLLTKKEKTKVLSSLSYFSLGGAEKGGGRAWKRRADVPERMGVRSAFSNDKIPYTKKARP